MNGGSANTMNESLLEVKQLTVSFHTDEGPLRAVDDVSFQVRKGESVGIVGESGAGKSVTALTIPRLIPSPPSVVEAGQVLYNGTNLLELDTASMRQVRGKSIGVIFQDSTTALSPLHRIGRQLVEAVRMHRDISGKEAWELAESWLSKVKIPDVKKRMFAYPHQLSGGMQQRIMIAMALIQEPSLIIADEPTTALDVTIQAQVFELIHQMRQNDTAMLLITHDMGVVWEMCDRVIVMYASQIVEEGTVSDIFSNPAHPYTVGLLKSIPALGATKARRLDAIPGQVPSALNYPVGCHFHDRCPHAFEPCRKESPGYVSISDNHRAACFLLDTRGGI